MAGFQFLSFEPLAQEESRQPSVGPLTRVGIEPVRVNVKPSLAKRLLKASVEKQKTHETVHFLLKDEEKRG